MDGRLRAQYDADCASLVIAIKIIISAINFERNNGDKMRVKVRHTLALAFTLFHSHSRSRSALTFADRAGESITRCKQLAEPVGLA